MKPLFDTVLKHVPTPPGDPEAPLQLQLPEGRAFMDYLRAEGIPFIAAWGAIPGSTSGAHIHVGQPSPRITVRACCP